MRMECRPSQNPRRFVNRHCWLSRAPSLAWRHVIDYDVVNNHCTRIFPRAFLHTLRITSKMRHLTWGLGGRRARARLHLGTLLRRPRATCHETFTVAAVTRRYSGSFGFWRKMTMSKKAAEHHKKASEHHTHAAHHHGEAAKHYDCPSSNALRQMAV
jgi:hypothetical protein